MRWEGMWGFSGQRARVPEVGGEEGLRLKFDFAFVRAGVKEMKGAKSSTWEIGVSRDGGGMVEVKTKAPERSLMVAVPI